MSIENVVTNMPPSPEIGIHVLTMSFIMTLDAMTGEVIHIGHTVL